MNFSLGTHFEDYVRNKVESGRYNNASEVIREALRLHEEQEAVREARLQRLKTEIAMGLESGEAEPLDINEIKAAARRRLAGQTGR
jgi:antitoxin ParD1/3/4